MPDAASSVETPYVFTQNQAQPQVSLLKRSSPLVPALGVPLQMSDI